MADCRKCGGTGKMRCRECNGSGHGVKLKTDYVTPTCFACDGSGDEWCTECNGTGEDHSHWEEVKGFKGFRLF